MAEQLDTPVNSLAFLELYHKSALKVEGLAQSLKKVSVALGIVAVFFLAMGVFNYMG